MALFSIEASPDTIRPYDVSADGQRFVVSTAIAGEGDLPIVLIDWTAVLPGDDASR